MIEHATTFNRILGEFLTRAERAYLDGDLFGGGVEAEAGEDVLAGRG